MPDIGADIDATAALAHRGTCGPAELLGRYPGGTADLLPVLGVQLITATPPAERRSGEGHATGSRPPVLRVVNPDTAADIWLRRVSDRFYRDG